MNVSMHKPIERYLKTNSEHVVFYQILGKGQPVLVVHGGPGAGCSLNMADFFDLEKFMIVLVDQRGCGKSTPNACINNNTTLDLINDFEAIRKQLKIEKWLLFGGSWGSTLSLVYAIYHPRVISGMVLRGVFLSTPKEISWLFQAAKYFNLQCWQDFTENLDNTGDILSLYYQKLTSNQPTIVATYAKRFAQMEATLSTLTANQDMVEKFTAPEFSKALAIIEVYYLKNNCFLPTKNYILDNIQIISHIPMKIVQGAYDLVCPPATAQKLHKHHINSTITLTTAGHSAFEPETKIALTKAMLEFA